MESILTEWRADRIGPDESGTLHRDGFQASPYRLREVRHVADWETIAVRRRAEIMVTTVYCGGMGPLRVGVVA